MEYQLSLVIATRLKLLTGNLELHKVTSSSLNSKSELILIPSGIWFTLINLTLSQLLLMTVKSNSGVLKTFRNNLNQTKDNSNLLLLWEVMQVLWLPLLDHLYKTVMFLGTLLNSFLPLDTRVLLKHGIFLNLDLMKNIKQQVAKASV